MDEELRKKKKKTCLFLSQQGTMSKEIENQGHYIIYNYKGIHWNKCTFLNISTCTNKKQSTW